MSNPTNRKPMTLTQKILAHHAQNLSRPWVQAGDVLQIRVDWTIASELAWNGMDRTYQMLGRPGVHDPKRFFIARRMRYWWLRSPSKLSTVSTICSSTRGPAIVPSLVTCPTRISAVPRSFAKRTSS